MTENEQIIKLKEELQIAEANQAEAAKRLEEKSKAIKEATKKNLWVDKGFSKLWEELTRLASPEKIEDFYSFLFDRTIKEALTECPEGTEFKVEVMIKHSNVRGFIDCKEVCYNRNGDLQIATWRDGYRVQKDRWDK